MCQFTVETGVPSDISCSLLTILGASSHNRGAAPMASLETSTGGFTNGALERLVEPSVLSFAVAPQEIKVAFPQSAPIFLFKWRSEGCFSKTKLALKRRHHFDAIQQFHFWLINMDSEQKVQTKLSSQCLYFLIPLFFFLLLLAFTWVVQLQQKRSWPLLLPPLPIPCAWDWNVKQHTACAMWHMMLGRLRWLCLLLFPLYRFTHPWCGLDIFYSSVLFVLHPNHSYLFETRRKISSVPLPLSFRQSSSGLISVLQMSPFRPIGTGAPQKRNWKNSTQ